MKFIIEVTVALADGTRQGLPLGTASRQVVGGQNIRDVVDRWLFEVENHGLAFAQLQHVEKALQLTIQRSTDAEVPS